jgi:hypothetical protein
MPSAGFPRNEREADQQECGNTPHFLKICNACFIMFLNLAGYILDLPVCFSQSQLNRRSTCLALQRQQSWLNWKPADVVL